MKNEPIAIITKSQTEEIVTYLENIDQLLKNLNLVTNEIDKMESINLFVRTGLSKLIHMYNIGIRQYNDGIAGVIHDVIKGENEN